MRRSTFVVVSSLSLVSGLFFAGCGSSGGSDGGSGGAPPSGGGTGTGGALSSGGSSTGGGTSSGGAASGGTSAGGASATGGGPSGGAPAAGGAGVGGGDVGSGGDGSGGGGSEPANIENSAGKVTITWGERTLIIDGTKGARITSLKSGASEFLSQVSGDSLYNYGSTFWTAPQTDWAWPPIVAVDSGAFTVLVEGETATFTSATASITDGTTAPKEVRIKKAFSVDTAHDVITIVYTIENTDDAQYSIGSWEITRVPASGLTFFPTGASASTPSGTMLPVTSQNDITWFQHSGSVAEGKLNADGEEGWLTHATANLALIKSFSDLADGDAAPGEGEVEIYAAPDASYVEVENQGEYKALAAGASLTYEVRWLLRDIPETVTVGAGSATLATFVRDELAAAGL